MLSEWVAKVKWAGLEKGLSEQSNMIDIFKINTSSGVPVPALYCSHCTKEIDIVRDALVFSNLDDEMGVCCDYKCFNDLSVTCNLAGDASFSEFIEFWMEKIKEEGLQGFFPVKDI